MDADKVMILVLALGLAASGVMIVLLARSYRLAQEALRIAHTEYAISLTNVRREAYMDGVAQAEREAEESFRRGLLQGEQRAIQALLADIQQDIQWN